MIETSTTAQSGPCVPSLKIRKMRQSRKCTRPTSHWTARSRIGSRATTTSVVAKTTNRSISRTKNTISQRPARKQIISQNILLFYLSEHLSQSLVITLKYFIEYIWFIIDKSSLYHIPVGILAGPWPGPRSP